MAGTETARFDFGLQFSELAWNDLLGPIFDEGGVVGELVDLLLGSGGDPDFTFTVSLDRPTDVAIPADAENPLDLRFAFTQGGLDINVRIVVGVVVDRSAETIDELVVDFDNELYHRRATINGGGVQFSDNDVQAIFRPIRMPVNVRRDTTNPGEVKRLDAKVVDDTSAADLDATALMMTFGGSDGGDINALRSFVPPGGRGAVGIFFQWLCRMAAPNMEDALGMDRGTFQITDTSMTFNGRITVDEEEDVDLTSLSMTLVDGAIAIAASVEKSGFCYEASGDVGASILLEIRDGRLHAEPDIAEPDIDIDIPWYCYVVGAVIGIVLGGILAGIIGAIVGGILVPLILWLGVEVIGGVADGIADAVVEAINNALPDTDTALPGIDIVFQRVFIDDVVIDANVIPRPGGTLRGEGSVRLRPGQGFDLDNGTVVTTEVNANSDVQWLGAGPKRFLKPGCGARLARTGRKDFGAIARYSLYGLAYAHSNGVAVTELTEDPFGIIPEFLEDLFGLGETLQVYAIDTDENRFAIVQAVQVEDSDVVLRWRCFDRRLAAVTIEGEFACEPGILPDRLPDTVFEPDLPPPLHIDRVPATTMIARRDAKGTAAMTVTPAQQTAIRAIRLKEPTRQIIAIGPQPRGQWVTKLIGKRAATARLRAKVTGLKGEVALAWWLDGEPISGASGEIDHDGQKVKWKFDADGTLLVTVAAAAILDLHVRVTATGTDGNQVTARRCLHRDGTCPIRKRVIPTFTAFTELRGVELSQIAGTAVVAGPISETVGLEPRRRTTGVFLPANADKVNVAPAPKPKRARAKPKAKPKKA